MTQLKKYKFSELYEMSSGISSKPEQAGHGDPFVSFKTVFNNYFLPEGLPDLMNTSDDEQKTYSIKEGDIFLTRTSESLDELGMSSVAYKDYPKATYSGFLKRLRPIKSETAYPKFMAFYLRSKLFRKTMNNNAIMTLRASFNEQIFSYLDLMLPDYQEQKKIGDFLFDIHQKIELNNRINAELEGMAKLIYDYWFVQFDFPSAFDSAQAPGKPYKSSGGKMVWNEELKRELPEGWEVKRLHEIANIKMGQSPEGSSYNDEGTGSVFFQGSTDFGWRFPTIRQYTTQPNRMASKGDILLSVRAPVGTLNIAAQNCCIGRGLAALNSKGRFDSYLFYVMEYFKKVFDNRNNSGTTFGSITKDDLYNLKLVYPSLDFLIKYDAIVSKFNQSIENNHKQNQELSALRDWLLPMLMNGQVRVGEETKEKYQIKDGEIGMVAEPKVRYKIDK
jgi:type I restriction enzyme S subunit